MYDPASGRVSRVGKDRALPPGARLLVPQAVAIEAAGAADAARRRERSPELAAARQRWVRELRRRVLYHDADLIAVDKPAGLAVQVAWPRIA